MIAQLIVQIPKMNRCVLEMLLKLLHEVLQNEAITKMTVINLAIVFSPTLNCPMELTKTLITHFEDIFNYDLIEL